MHVRFIALALAIPLTAGLACKTSSAHQGSSTTASTESQRSQEQGQAATGTATSGQDPAAVSSRSDTTTGTHGKDTNQTPTPGASDESTAGTAQSGSPSSSGAMSSGSTSGSMDTGSMASSSGASDDVKAHASDKIVAGRVTKLSERSIEIRSEMGEAKTLQLVPETSFMIDGRDGRRTDLREGQEVRASYNDVDGKDVAVEIHTGHHAGSGSGQGGSSSMPHDMGTGTGSSGTTSQESGTGTMPEETDPKESPSGLPGPSAADSAPDSKSSGSTESGRRY